MNAARRGRDAVSQRVPAEEVVVLLKTGVGIVRAQVAVAHIFSKAVALAIALEVRLGSLLRKELK